MCELREQIESLHHSLDGLTALFNVRHIKISQRRRHLKVADPAGINPHQPTTGSVGGYRIVREDEASKTPNRACKGPLPSMASIPSAITK